MGKKRSNPEQVPVIFKKLNGKVVAFLLRHPAQYGSIMTFSDAGYAERSMRDYFESENVSPCEYASLLKTMQALGINVLVRNRMTYVDRMYSWKVV